VLLCFVLTPFSRADDFKQRSQPTQASSAWLFYSSLANSIRSLDGTMTVSLRPGTWRTTMEGHSVQWAVAANTTATIRISPAATSVAFFPSLTITSLGPFPASGTLNRVEMSGGRVTTFDFHLTQDASLDPNGAGTALLEQQATPSGIADLLLGNLFVSSSSAASCDAGGKNCRGDAPMFDHISLGQDSNGASNVRLQLRAGATLNLSRPFAQNTRNFLTLAGDVQATLSSLSYDAREERVSGTLTGINAEVSSFRMAAGGIDLQGEPGSHVEVQSLHFEGARLGNGTVDITGAAAVQISPGSSLLLSRDPQSQTLLHIGPGSVIRASSVHAVYNDAQGYSVSVEDASVSLRSITGDLAFGPIGQLSVAASEAALRIPKATWKEGGRPVVAATVHAALQLESGNIGFAGCKMVVTGGGATVDLSVDTAQQPVITGSFGKLSVAFAENSEFCVPGSFYVRTQAGARLEAANDSDPFRFGIGKNFAIGTYSVKLPFYKLASARDSKFGFENGNAEFPLTVGSDGRANSTQTAFRGALRISTGSNVSRLNASAHANLSYSANAPAQPATVSGTWSGSTTINQTFPVDTPPYSHGTAEQFFSVHLIPSLHQVVNFTDVPYQITAQGFQSTVAVAANVNLNIPNGGGEYRNPTNPHDGFKKGNGEVDTWQEVWTDTFHNPFFCRRHMFLKPRDYNIPGTLVIQFSGDQSTGRLDNANTPQLEAETRGCGGPFSLLADIGQIGANFTISAGLSKAVSGWKFNPQQQ